MCIEIQNFAHFYLHLILFIFTFLFYISIFTYSSFSVFSLFFHLVNADDFVGGHYTQEEMNVALAFLSVIMVMFFAVCACQCYQKVKWECAEKWPPIDPAGIQVRHTIRPAITLYIGHPYVNICVCRNDQCHAHRTIAMEMSDDQCTPPCERKRPLIMHHQTAAAML